MTTQWTYALGKRANALRYAADGLAARYGCRCWLEWSDKEAGEDKQVWLVFLGPADARKPITAALDRLKAVMDTEWQCYRLDRTRKAHWDLKHGHLRGSWEQGFAARVGERLHERTRVTKAVKAAVDATFQRIHETVALPMIRSHVQTQPDALQAGRQAADAIDIKTVVV